MLESKGSDTIALTQHISSLFSEKKDLLYDQKSKIEKKAIQKSETGDKMGSIKLLKKVTEISSEIEKIT